MPGAVAPFSDRPYNRKDQTMTVKMKTYILLDRSGSMIRLWDEMTEAVATFAEGIKKNLFVGCFDSFDELSYQPLHDGKAKDWDARASMKEFGPRGITPLFDAIGKLYEQIEQDAPKKAQIVIVTDGQENASTNWRRGNAQAAIKKFEEQGYDVVWMGASFDRVYAQSASLGLSAGKTVNVADKANLSATMTAMSTRNVAYSKGDITGADDLDDNIRKGAGE